MSTAILDRIIFVMIILEMKAHASKMTGSDGLLSTMLSIWTLTLQAASWVLLPNPTKNNFQDCFNKSRHKRAAA